jgi:hypothetical protein
MENQENSYAFNRKNLLMEIREDIDHIITLINSFEKIRLVSAIGISPNGVTFTRPTLPNILETSIEYALSIATSTANNIDAPIPSAEDILDILTKLEAIREKYLKYILSEDNPERYSILEQNLRNKVIENTLTVRGQGYRVHIDEVFLELFNPHLTVFRTHYGFDHEDISGIIQYMEDEVEINQQHIAQEHKEFVKWLKKQDIKVIQRKYGHLPLTPFLLPQVYQLETQKTVRFKSVEDTFRFDLNDLDEGEKQVIRELSTSFGDNISFLDPRFKAFPLNDTLIISKPVLYSPERNSYYCFSPRILHRNIFNIGEHLLQNANNDYFQHTYLGKGVNSRSSYFENKVADLINKIMPSYSVYSNLKYKIANNEYEIDILIETNDQIFLIEVKSGLYSNAAKSGAIKNLKSDMTDFVGYASEQLTRTQNYITTCQPLATFHLKDSTTININSHKDIIKIVVPFDSIIGITNQLYELSKVGITSPQKDFPLSFSIFDFMVISEIFENNEAGFIEFAKARVELCQEENFKVLSELDFLGLFLSREYKKILKTYTREKKVLVDSKFRRNIDDYYDAKFHGIRRRLPKKIR